MRIIHCFLIVSMFAACSCLGQSSKSVNLKRLDETEGVQPASGDFMFSISPDDHWLAFFKRVEGPTRPEVDDLYGNLRVMDLRSRQIYAFTLNDMQAPMSAMLDAEVCWSSDSSLCVLPPPPAQDRRIVISFPDGKPTLAFVPYPRWGDVVDPASPPIILPDHYTCSDCSPHMRDAALLKKCIPAEYYVGTSDSPPSHMQIVSPDGTKVYYQKGPQGRGDDQTHETTLYEVDVATGREHAIVTHQGDCPRIDELDVSPDGKKLAYQVTTGCGFISTPKIYVLDLATGKPQSITFGDGTMHWSSASDKLYFYRRWVEGEHGDYLWVAEFPSPTPASQPASAQPAASQPRPATPSAPS